MAFEFIIEESQKIKGVYIITPSISKDLRGNIWTSFYQEEIEKLLPVGLHFKHDKFSQSRQNVLRGIHGDSKMWKLVSVVYGEVYQYIVDLRPNSDTYMKWEQFLVNHTLPTLFLLPPYIGNAYYVNSDTAIYQYKFAYYDNYADVDEQFTLAWNDARINIILPNSSPVLSVRDTKSSI